MELLSEQRAKRALQARAQLSFLLLKAGMIGILPPTLREDLLSSVSRPALVIGCRS